jgi:hypothetical protein
LYNYKIEEAIGFDIVDNAERRFGWYGKEPGVINPYLPWETEYLGDKDMVRTRL